MRYPIFETELLIKPIQGVYRVTTYYSDGSVEERDIHKGPIILPVYLDV